MKFKKKQLDVKRILDRFKEIEVRVETLRELGQSSEAEFVADDLVMAASERNLMVAIQACKGRTKKGV